MEKEGDREAGAEEAALGVAPAAVDRDSGVVLLGPGGGGSGSSVAGGAWSMPSCGCEEDEDGGGRKWIKRKG